MDNVLAVNYYNATVSVKMLMDVIAIIVSANLNLVTLAVTMPLIVDSVVAV
jgi:hypothetical protein